MGMCAADVPPEEKRNYWLKTLPPRPHLRGGAGYVLFCPSASTPVRSIWRRCTGRSSSGCGMSSGRRLPGSARSIISRRHRRYRAFARYRRFLNWVRHARYVVTSDTAALHIAAGFDVPTTAFFTTIAPQMRARDYLLLQRGERAVDGARRHSGEQSGA